MASVSAYPCNWSAWKVNMLCSPALSLPSAAFMSTAVAVLFVATGHAAQALATLCGEKDGIRDLTLPQHWMRDFFLAHLCLEMQHNAEGLSRLQVVLHAAPCMAVVPQWRPSNKHAHCKLCCMQALSEQFPRSDWIVCQAAIAHYNLRNFDEAEDLFQDLLERDPHRIEVRAPARNQHRMDTGILQGAFRV